LATIIYKTSGICRNEKRTENKELQRQRGKGFLWNQLKLDTIQEVTFKEKGKLFFDSIKVINRLRDSLAKQIAEELKKEKPDMQLIYDLSQKMGDNYGRSKKLSVDHIIELKKLCRPDQLEKLDSMYYFMLIGFEKNRHQRPGQGPNRDSLRSERPEMRN
jgi:hypothetical protein